MLKFSNKIFNLGRGDAYVKAVFDNVATKYDFMNDAMSLGVHRCWKNYYVRNVVKPRPGGKYLDVAGGTGDIAFRIFDVIREKHEAVVGETKDIHGRIGDSEIIVLDINEKMLEGGKVRAVRNNYPNIKWVQGSAEDLPFESNTFDAYTVAFGLRNFTNRQKALEEAYRVLRVGGCIHVLEFSKVNCKVVDVPYQLWGTYVMPKMGKVFARDEASYQYLVDSIRAFPDQEKFAAMIKEAGFGYVNYENLSFGIASIHTGVKTEEEKVVNISTEKGERTVTERKVEDIMKNFKSIDESARKEDKTDTDGEEKK